MKKILLAFLFLSCVDKKSTDNLPLPFIYIDHKKIPEKIHTPIKNAVENYYNNYGVPDSVSVSVSSKLSQKNMLFFCDSTVKYFTPEIAYSATTHELFHTLHNDDTTFIKPFSILNGKYKVLGYCGLSVLFQKVDGKISLMRSIEEASAELSAMLIVPNYRATSKLYAELGNKLANKGKGKFKFMDLVKFQRNNDLPAFCGRILKKDKSKVTNKDIEGILMFFGF